MAFQFPVIMSSLWGSLSQWSWDNPFHVAIFALFMVGFVPEFILLRMKWRPWAILLIMFSLVLGCELFLFVNATEAILQVVGTVEMLFVSALFGSCGALAVHLFWEYFKKKKPKYLEDMEKAEQIAKEIKEKQAKEEV